MVLLRILTCRGRVPLAKQSYCAKWRTANQIAQRPLVSQSRVEQRTHSGDEIETDGEKAVLEK